MKKIFTIIKTFTFLIIIFTGSQAQYWQKVVNMPAQFLNNYWLDVYFLPANPNYGWVCGFQGRVLRTTDGGNSWLGAVVPDADHLESIHFPTVNIGYCSGPAGIFKSTDGGASWFNISPLTSANLWGTYFYDANSGMVLGDGCNGDQEFWRTTDGGASWNVYYGTEPNSGLTDAIIYNINGLGYAVSSGRLWITTNGGQTWSIYAYTGPNIWQEELTEFMGSFLLPYAGNDCSGQGSGGGIRFSTNDGLSWNNYDTGDKMFGTFLLDKSTGWACGYNRQIYYTANAGQSWSSKNCGIEPGNLDDMWFIDSQTGWVVGEGVYRLAPPTIALSKDTVNFGEVCPPNKKYDTLWLNNLSFNAAPIQIQITGKDYQDFTLIEPDNYFTAQQCQTLRIIIEFVPSGSGRRDASLYVLGNAKSIIIPIIGWSETSTANLSDTLMVIDKARCGFDNRDTIIWRSPANKDKILAVQHIEGDTAVKYKSYYPQTIYDYGTRTDWGINPPDTGWYSARFKVTLSPCDKDTFVTFRAYGISPIITSDNERKFSGKCSSSISDTLKITNTGNIDLTITSAQILEANSGFKISGWSSGNAAPVRLKPNESDNIILTFDRSKSSGTATLRLINNDSTRARGRKNPFDIKLDASISYSDIKVKDTLIDFGQICLGDSVSKTIELINTGNASSDISLLDNTTGWLNIYPSAFPLNIIAKDTLKLTIKAKPGKRGYYEEHIKFKSAYCEETFDITIRIMVLEAIVEPLPDLISGLIKTMQPEIRRITLNSIGNADLTITNVYLNPVRSDWTIKCLQTLPLFLKSGGQLPLDIEFLSGKDTTLKGELCFTAEGQCPIELCVPVDLNSQSVSITYSPQLIDFGLSKCEPVKLFDTVRIVSEGTGDESIKSITFETQTNVFSIQNPVSMPYNLKGGSTLTIILAFNPASEGKFDNKLIITLTSINEDLIIPITGSFKKTLTTISDTLIHFKDVEYCESRTRTISIGNSGLLDDTLIITKINNHPYFSIFPAARLVVPSMTDTVLTISYTGPEIPYSGLNMETFKLSSIVCSAEINIAAKANIQRLKLQVIPDTLDFGTIWLGESDTKNITIINPHKVDFTIDWALINPADAQFDINLATPVDILTDDTLNFPVTFDARQAGQYQRRLIIPTHSNCPDTLMVMLNARARDDSFATTVKIGNYFAKGGDIIAIALILKDSVPETKPDRIDYEIRFDPALYYPMKGYVKSEGNFKDIDINYYYGVLSGTLDSSYSVNLLDRADTLLMFKGLVLVSVPDLTPLTITKFGIITKRKVTINKEHGSLQLADYCEPIAKLKFVFIANFTANLRGTFQSSDDLELSIRTNVAQKLNIVISDATGGMIEHSFIDASPNDTEYSLNISNLSQGLYFINISSSNGTIWRDRFIRMK